MGGKWIDFINSDEQYQNDIRGRLQKELNEGITIFREFVEINSILAEKSKDQGKSS